MGIGIWSSGDGVQGLGFRAWGSGVRFRVWVSGFGFQDLVAQALGCEHFCLGQVLGCGVWCLGSRVRGLGVRRTGSTLSGILLDLEIGV